MTRRFAVVAALLGAMGTPASHAAPTVPRFSHVFEVFMENENAPKTWEDPVNAPGLAALAKANLYIPEFYGVGHASLSNYMAAFGAVEPTTQGKADCLGMPYGSCIFPASVPTIANLLDEAGLSWKVYAEGMDGAPAGGPCLHAPSRSLPDPYQGPFTNGYATRHNPAPWFDAILLKGPSEQYCKEHVVDLKHLADDLKNPSALPAFSFIEPDTCHDGHDTSSLGGCTADPEGPNAPSGVKAMDEWLPKFVAQVVTSPAWDARSLIFATLDEAEAAEGSGCVPCGDGSAGGRIGAVAISPLVRPGLSGWRSDHYGFLRTLEASWGLPTLKSRAASADAAKLVHDGDAGVVALSGVWVEPGSVLSSTVSPGGGSGVPRSLPRTGARIPRLAALGIAVVALGALAISAARH